MPIQTGTDTAKTRRTLSAGAQSVDYFSIAAATEAGLGDFSKLPASLKVVLENMLRFEDGRTVSRRRHQGASRQWATDGGKSSREIAFRPARVLMQDFTGVPAVVDLAAMRDGITALGGDPQKINPLIAGRPGHRPLGAGRRVRHRRARFQRNIELEYERNRERYTFLRWGQSAFDNFRVVPPGTGICHQVNLEYLAQARLDRHDRPARPSPIPTRWSAPTATPRWSTAWACWAGASAASRPRRRCSASRSRC